MTLRADSRKPLPTGTITLLFADVEGSTRLLTLLGDRYLGVRARSRELVREVASAHGGHEVDWAGDGVFLAFERARDAVAAAASLQRALAHERWPAGGAVRLRIGVHSGEPELDADGYVGLSVVIAARICAAAHGGQVVVSETTRSLVGEKPLPGATLRLLGTFHLKDLPDPQPLYQLEAPDLPTAFPPLATVGGGTLPTLHHRLVGRDEQVAAILDLLARPDVRLITVTGVGGAGKSRVALEVAAESSTTRPVRLVGLAALADAALVPEEIARSLGIAETAPGSALVRVAEALRGTRTLLTLDNLEHLPAAATHVRELLDAIPDLDVLATSRVPLNLSGERVLHLEPLEPDAAVELFVERAAERGLRAAEALLPTIRAICERVDCLPLAIELVAARLAVLSASQLLEQLDSGYALDLQGPVDAPERQRTLRTTLDWSYDLLTPAQRALHGALAVFAGGCALDDARAVAGAPDGFLTDLETLVLGSLVRGSAAEGETRLVLLETVREYALDRLAAEGRLEELRRRHAERFATLAREGARGLEGSEHAAWADRLERELDNIRAALDWLLAAGRVAEALETTALLERFWRARGHVTEARRRLAASLECGGDVGPSVRAAALWTGAQQAAAQSDWGAAEAMLGEARELYRALGDARSEALALANASFVALRRGDLDHASRLAQDAVAVADPLDDPRAAAAAAMAAADVLSTEGAHERALESYARAVRLRSRLGDPLLVCDAVYNLGLAAHRAADRRRAREAFENALAQARELHEAPYVAASQLLLAILDLLEGEPAAAEPRARECLELYTALDDERSRARCLTVLAAALAGGQALADAARLLGAARAARAPDPPDEFEAPIVEALEPRLESALGHQRLRALYDEGALEREGGPALVSKSTAE